MSNGASRLAEQFDDDYQQRSAASLGMWIFIATEVLFFGVLFLAYIAYRISYPREFYQAAEKLNVIIGTANTAILLISSFFMALAVGYSKAGKGKQTSIALIITWWFGAIFLLIKAYEYYDDIRRNLVPTDNVAVKSETHAAKLFYLIYYTITGVHALHLTIGLGVVMVMIIRNHRKQFSKSYYTPIEMTGLYWHFVDIVWIFVYPSLYLVGRNI